MSGGVALLACLQPLSRIYPPATFGLCKRPNRSQLTQTLLKMLIHEGLRREARRA
jgi:hypothetical protein